MSHIIDTARLNYPLIRTRALSLGLTPINLTKLLGVRLEALEVDLDQRSVSLTMLVRLSRVLDLSLDELVVIDGPTPTAPQPTGAAGDDATILALVATYSGITIDRVLTLLHWRSGRLEAALASLDDQLQVTPLRLVVTDAHLSLALRGVLPDDTRERLDLEQRQREPLAAHDAAALLILVLRKILEPFPDSDEDPESLPTEERALDLVNIGLAVPVAAGRLGDVQPHPDVMFALRLAAEPDTSPGQPAFRTALA